MHSQMANVRIRGLWLALDAEAPDQHWIVVCACGDGLPR